MTFYPDSPGESTTRPKERAAQRAALAAAATAAIASETAAIQHDRVRNLPTGAVEALATELAAGDCVGEELQCPLTTLSSVVSRAKLKRIDVLKIDVEGAELDVLSGLELDDWHKVARVVVEVHDVDGRLGLVIALLHSRGFSCLRNSPLPIIVWLKGGTNNSRHDN